MKARFEEVMPQTIYAYISDVASRKKSPKAQAVSPEH